VTAAEHFVAIARKLHLADPADQRAAADHGIALTKLVELLPDSSVGARLAALRESVPLLEEMSMKNAKNAETRIFLSFAQMQLGNALAARHDSAGATAAWNRAISIAEPLLSTGQRSPTVTYILACRYLGEAAAARGDRAAAEEFASKAWVAGNPAGALAKSRSPEVQKLVTPATFAARGFVYEKLGDRGRAVEAFTDGAAAWREAASVSSAGAVLRREMQQAAAQLAALEGRRK